MISPIRDSKGNPKSLYDIEYEDLAQLLDFDEGYAVEYKSSFQEVKRKIANIACSFANSSGGWLFVGVDNEGNACDICKERSDFSQALGEIVRTRVSPLPHFDCKFVKNEKTKDAGVLVVRIDEGYEPPYISSGTVYVRTGSSTEPVKANDAAILRSLEEKRRREEGRRQDFYKRDIYFPAFQRLIGGKERVYPLLNVYLYRPVAEKRWFNGEHLDQAREKLREILGSKPGWEDCIMQETPRSFVIHQGRMNCLDSVHNIIELYINGSIKAHIPMCLLQQNEKKEALEKLNAVQMITNHDQFLAIDGKRAVNISLSCAEIVDALLEMHPLCGDAADYLAGFELESCDGAIVFSDNEYYYNYVRLNGMPYFSGSNIFEYDRELKALIDENGKANIAQMVLAFLFPAMGFPWYTRDDELCALPDKVIMGADYSDKSIDGTLSTGVSDDEPRVTAE